MSDHPQTTWESDTVPPPYPSLTESIEADVAIIGGGITGISTAYMLAAAGKKVVVLEGHTLGSGATCRTTAIITRSIDIDTKPLVETQGKDNAKKILESHQHAIDTIEKNVQENKLDCEFMRAPNFAYAPTKEDVSSLAEEFTALQEIDMPATMSHDALSGFVNEGSIAIPDQAKFHPLKYLYGLAEAATKKGAVIYCGTEVTHIEHGGAYKGPFTLTTSTGGSVFAEYVFSATHIPFQENQPLSLYFMKGKYYTYMMEVEIPSGTIAEGTYEDMGNPYNYFRIDAKDGHDRMLFGGEDHRADIPVNHDKSFAALEDHLKEVIPNTAYTITRKWYGPIVEPTDGFAFIGPAHEGDKFFYATGYSGTGMTYGTIAAEIITGLVTGTPSEYETLYTGFALKSFAAKAVDYAEELIGGAVKNTFEYDHNEVEGKSQIDE